MNSMTGYGAGSATGESTGVRIDVAIATVNRKNLDTQITAPRDWNGFDQRCQEWVKAHFHRGRVTVRVDIRCPDKDGAPFEADTAAMDAALHHFRRFAEERNIPFIPDARFLLELARGVRDSDESPDWETLQTELKAAFDQAAGQTLAMRAREGAALAADLDGRLRELAGLADSMASHAAEAPAKRRDALLERLRNLQLELDPEDERVLKELALFADRADITEELTRLRSHLEQFSGFMRAAEPVGRKMDFLCQEILREFNTIGSKAADRELTKCVIEGKNAVEQIREQVQNIE